MDLSFLSLDFFAEILTRFCECKLDIENKLLNDHTEFRKVAMPCVVWGGIPQNVDNGNLTCRRHCMDKTHYFCIISPHPTLLGGWRTPLWGGYSILVLMCSKCKHLVIFLSNIFPQYGNNMRLYPKCLLYSHMLNFSQISLCNPIKWIGNKFIFIEDFWKIFSFGVLDIYFRVLFSQIEVYFTFINVKSLY